MFCSKCGKQVAEDAGFCPACGNAIESDVSMEGVGNTEEMKAAVSEPEKTVVAQQAPQGSYCAGCGTYIEAEQQFCPKCGTAKGGVKREKADNELLSMVKAMIKTPVDGFTKLYQTNDMKTSVVFVVIQVVLAVVFGALLNNKLITSYNEYIQNLTVNLTNSLSEMLGELGSIVPGVGGAIAGEIVGSLLGSSGIDAAIVNMLKYNSDMIGIGVVLLTVLGAILAQMVLLFVLMKIFKLDGAFMDAVKIYSAKSFWSALGMIISLLLLLISPLAAMGFIVVAGCFINHSIGQTL